MKLITQLSCLVTILALSSAERGQSRWSRQISSHTSDFSDWVPLPGPGPLEREPLPPIKRQAIAEPRILAEPMFPGFARPSGFNQEFPQRNYYNPPTNRQLYLQSVPAVPSAPQNFLSDQGFNQGLAQNIRFGISQPSFPLNQGFVSQQFPFDTMPQFKPRPQASLNPIKFESIPKMNLPLSPQAKPFNQGAKKPEAPKFVDGYRVIENISISSDSSLHKKKPQSLQKIKFENYDQVPKTEIMPPKSKSEREEVQLLYVPVESLNRGSFNFRSPLTSSQFLNTEPHQAFPRPGPIKQTYPSNDFQRPAQKPLETFNDEQDFYNNFARQPDQVPKYSTQSTPFPTAPPTTAKPKKLKPHQPPLAIFLTKDANKQNQIKVGDVLSSLKNAETISVLDSVNPKTAPKVFIGPSSLNPPEQYVKFELPYLSNIENTNNKLRQLPFFVAPLSYNTPQGFAKIPFPSPHVGSVVINSQIRTQVPPSTSNSYSTSPQSYKPSTSNSYLTSPPTYKTEPRTTPKPAITYYSTAAPKTNAPPSYQADQYSIEPQNVRQQPAEVPPPKTGSFFLSNTYNQQSADFPAKPYPNQQNYNPTKISNPGTPKTVYSTTPSKLSTYPNLLETHNPYSINQAFHLSTPSDYHHLYEESYPNQEFGQQSTPVPPSTLSSTQAPTSSSKPDQVTEKQRYSSQSPSFIQNYSPEIHYSSEGQNSKYPSYNSQEYTGKPELTSQFSPSSSISAESTAKVSSASPNDYNANTDSQAPVRQNYDNSYESETKSPYLYNQYETNHQSNYQTEVLSSTSTTTTTTTTPTPTTSTRRIPARSKGRPRHTTPRPDSAESTTRTVATRRPLRERRPLPPRSKYEPNKVTSERSTRKPADSGESTTKNYRNRTRGRVQYKYSDNDDSRTKGSKQSSKEADLAYQRDVLHQNYPVTLMERASTIDIEAITEPSPRISSTKNLDNSETYDTDNAYSYDRASFSQHIPISSKEETHTFASKLEIQTEAPFVSKFDNEYTFHSRSSLAPVDAVSAYGETSPEKEDESYAKQTTPIQNSPNPEIVSYTTETSSVATESQSSYSANNDYIAPKQEEVTTNQEFDSTKVSQEAETEVNVVQTTPSYNRVRVRPGVIRQYHQALSTTSEASKTKTDRRRPIQAVTYRPAFNGRRTTMRIEEIEADLKTKPVHARPEQEYRHPVYRPDPSTEAAATQTYETTTKRGGFRRRRPSYSTTTTEASVTTAKKAQNYEVKGRFRGRRPTTEKSIEKTDAPTEVTTSTVRQITRYSRPRLSDRYNKKTETEDSEDQESNHSINRPKYVEPDSDQWSPKVTGDTFKPYNPNDIVGEKKVNYDKYDKYEGEDPDIITARNEYDDILISVTPASNNRNTKKIPDIPPTLEALVEQSKTTHSDNGEQMSTFETMLEEVMKSLEEQDEDEYSSNVMKHKGGEIGEIPPERIISSEDNNAKATTVDQSEHTTVATVVEDSTDIENEEDTPTQTRRRGFWKKVAVRPITESIEAAESQYYTSTANRLSHTVTLSKTIHDKNGNYEKSKVTTYKPTFEFIKDMFEIENDEDDNIPLLDIPKIIKQNTDDIKTTTESVKETTERLTDKNISNGDSDTEILDSNHHSTHTESTSEGNSNVDRSDGFNFMEYLFGVASENKETPRNDTKIDKAQEKLNEYTTEKPNKVTTETTFIPEEITAVPTNANQELVTEFEIKKISKNNEKVAEISETETTDKIEKLETSSVSSFMENPSVSTSMSVEVSHETEMCYRGRCIKTSSDAL